MSKLDIKKLKETNTAWFKNDEIVKWFEDNVVESNGTCSLKTKSNISLKHIPVYEMKDFAPLLSSYYFIIKELKVLPKAMDFSLLCKVIQMYLGETSMFKVKLYATIMVLIELGM